ncbi:MAG: EAL domain-containing protein [Hyphomicrobiaceae bacterium]|nr:MAG: EAL domain-containing protein [Hyphomicrobiaceae bacterium]
MTQQFGIPDAAPHEARFSDIFVIFSVTVLSLASGAWLLAQVGVALWWAMIGALAIYSVLLSVHLLVRRSLVAAASRPAADDHDTDWLGDQLDLGEPPPRHVFADSAPLNASVGAEPRPFQEPRPAASPREPGIQDIDLLGELPAPRPAAPFDFRPAPMPSLAEPAAVSRPAQPAERRAPVVEPPPPTATSPSEKNVELIQDLIKKLADELNGVPPPAAQERAAQPPSTQDAEGMIGRSVAALEAAARTMRAPGVAPPEQRAAAPAKARLAPGTLSSWWPVTAKASATAPQAEPAEAGPAAPPVLNPQLARIAEAVAAERLEILLEPIHALAEGRPRHFEVSVRLLTADGAALEQRDFSRAAQGSGLMPHIDAVRLLSAARIARRLGERGRQGAVIAAVTGESLSDAGFIDTTAKQPASDGRMNLVLSFAQSEARNFTTGHAEALRTMAAAGFRFALEDVTDLDMDFGSLGAMGFQFVKLDAPVFLEGLPAPGGRVPASDICRHLADFGLTLIVGRIEDDWLLARILGFGVLFGKGTLFGGPKLVKPDVVAKPAAA